MTLPIFGWLKFNFINDHLPLPRVEYYLSNNMGQWLWLSW